MKHFKGARHSAPTERKPVLKGGQYDTQNPKKLAAPFRWLLSSGLPVGAGVIGACLLFLNAWNTINLPGWIVTAILLYMIGLTLLGLYIIDFEEERREALEKEIASFPAEEFLRGMNEFGVETIIGGVGLTGEWATDIRLRFPATVLQKHLTDAMMHGYIADQLDRGLVPNREQERLIHEVFAKRSIGWIEQMTQGTR